MFFAAARSFGRAISATLSSAWDNRPFGPVHNHHFAAALSNSPVLKHRSHDERAHARQAYHLADPAGTAAGKRKLRGLLQKYFAVQVDDRVVRSEFAKKGFEPRVGGVGQLFQQDRVASPKLQ